jgi:hypothetical protein
MTDGVSELVAHRYGKKSVNGNTEIPHQFIGSYRTGKKQSLFQKCLAFIEEGKRRAASVQVQP